MRLIYLVIGYIRAVIEELESIRQYKRPAQQPISPRTHKIGQIVLFVNESEVAIARGAREGVEIDSIYCIRQNDQSGEIVALLKVYEVWETLALARPLWVSEKCVWVKRGWHVFLMEIAEA